MGGIYLRRSKWAAGLGLAVCLVLSLAGCGSKTQQSSEPIEGLDQLGDIQVILYLAFQILSLIIFLSKEVTKSVCHLYR